MKYVEPLRIPRKDKKKIISIHGRNIYNKILKGYMLIQPKVIVLDFPIGKKLKISHSQLFYNLKD